MESMLFAVIYRPGAAWAGDLPFHEQAGITDHRDFLIQSHADGILMCAGPFLDDAGGLAIFHAATAQELAQRIERDKTIERRLMSYELHPLALPFGRANVASGAHGAST